MLFDRPARLLYRHHRDLYIPMRLFATEYRHIVYLSVGLVVLGVLAALGILR
jgi:hypothetical protein